MPANPGQRPRSTSPVPGEGPAKLLPVQPPQVRTVPDPAALPTRVFDAGGRPLSGMLRVAPNRAFDPATGRYYRPTSAGKILGPPPVDRCSPVRAPHTPGARRRRGTHVRPSGVRMHDRGRPQA